MDCITSVKRNRLLRETDNERKEFAGKLVDIMGLTLCKKVQMSNFGVYISEELLNFIEEILKGEIETICANLEKIAAGASIG